MQKIANVLEKLPTQVQPQAKSMIHQFWQAETRESAEQAFDRFLATLGDKCPKATKNLASGRDRLLAFYDFPGNALAAPPNDKSN